MTTNTTPSQAASFRSELLPILRNMYLRLELDAIDDEIYSVLDMIDAKLAQAGDDWRDRAYTLEARLGEVMVKRDELRGRATAAESRLAEIQRGVEELLNIWSEIQASQLHATYEVCRKTVLRLFNPPSQSDTSGLPG